MDGMSKAANKLIGILKMKAECGHAFEISELLARTAFEVVSSCGFDWSEEMIEKHGDAALNMSYVLVKVLALVYKDPLSFKIPWARLSEKQEFRNAVLPMREVNKKHLETVKDEAVTKDNILSNIIQANSCSDELTIEDVVDDYNTFITAGMETTGITMACAIWFLSKNQKAQAEVDSVMGDRDQLIFEDLTKLVYTETIIKETLRLKTPLAGTIRQCIKNHGASVNGVHFPKGTQLFVPYPNLHVHARYWKDPDVFDPERFAPSSAKNIAPCTYMPFSTGPRNCIGKNFAMLEMKIILANILRNFVVVNANPDEKELETVRHVTIRPINGVNVRLVSRVDII